MLQGKTTPGLAAILTVSFIKIDEETSPIKLNIIKMYGNDFFIVMILEKSLSSIFQRVFERIAISILQFSTH